MRIEQMDTKIKKEAYTLAQENYRAEPAIQRIYLFPSNNAIRLVEIDPTTRPNNNGNVITPFYFGPDPANGYHFPVAIALITPEEDHNHILPTGWGEWNEAELIEQR